MIYCCNCAREVDARLTTGKEIYPHRPDLWDLPFWKCDDCGGHVGCHHKTKNLTRPLGCISSPEIIKARKEIHKLIDPLWRGKFITRRKLYQAISEHLGYEYHAGEIRSLEEARKVYRFVKTTQYVVAR